MLSFREIIFLLGCIKTKSDTIRNSPNKDIITPMFYVSKKYNFVHFYISKNACTFIKGILYNERFNLIPNESTPKEAIHWGMTDVHGKEYIFPCNRDISMDGKVRFMIYRDPVERFRSAYKELKYEMETGASNHYVYRAFKKSGMADFKVEHALRFARQEHLYRYPNIEQHIAKQALYYEFYKGYGIDYIVNLSNLDRFLREVLGIDGFNKLNYSREKLDLTPQQIEKVRNLYKDDLKILESFKGDKSYL